MIIVVPFVYRMQHVPKGRRKPVWTDVLDVAPVMIEEFSEAEAKLAFAAPRAPGFGQHPSPEIHISPRGLVAPLYGTTVGGQDNASVTATKATIAHVLHLPVDRRNPFADVQKGRNAMAFLTTKDRAAFASSRRIVEEDRAARIAEITRYAAGFCFVGDTLCRDAPEPVWHVIVDDRFASVVRRRHPMPPNEIVWPGAALYRADRLDAAVAHARRKAVAAGLDPDAVTVDGAIEVMTPEAVSFDDENYALIEAAREGVKWRLKEGHHELDGPMAEFDLALATGRGNESTAKAIEDLIGWLEDEELGDHAGPFREFVERRAGLPQTAIRRAIEIDEALAGVNMDMLK